MHNCKEPEETLAQPKDSMFERNIGHMASRNREAYITTSAFPMALRGFLAGLDEEWLQICLTEDQTLAEIRRDTIVMVMESGRTLSDLERESTLSEQDARKIREKTEHFQRKSSHVFRRQS